MLGADRWRNPDEDLPQDFEQRRTEHYAALSKPLDPSRVHRGGPLRDASRAAGASPGAAASLPFLEIADRGKQGAIKLTPLTAQPDPPNLNALKARDARPLGDGRADRHAQGVDPSHRLPEDRQRHGPGRPAQRRDAGRAADAGCSTLTGRTPASEHVAAGDHGHSEDDLRYVRRRFLTAELVRSFAIEIANATFAARDPRSGGRRRRRSARTPSTSARSTRTS